MNNLTFGEYLKSLRKEKGYSQRKLGMIAGVSNTTVKRLEDNTNEPDLETIVKLSTALKHPLEELLKFRSSYAIELQNKNLPQYVHGIEEDYIVLAKEIQDKNISPDRIRKIMSLIDEK